MYGFSASFDVAKVLFEVKCKLSFLNFIGFEVILAEKSTFILF